MQAQCLGMMTFTELASVLAGRPLVFTEQLRLAVVAYTTWPASGAPPASTPTPTRAATCPGARTAAWTGIAE